MDNCNKKDDANGKNCKHTGKASFHSKSSPANFKEQDCLKKAKKVTEKHRLKPYRIEEYLTAEYSRHLENILCPNTQKQVNDAQQNKEEYKILHRQKQSPFFHPIIRICSNQRQNTSSDNNEVHETNKYQSRDNDSSNLLPHLLPTHCSLQYVSRDPDETQNYSDYNNSHPPPKYMLHYQQGHPQKRRHQHNHHHRPHQHHQNQQQGQHYHKQQQHRHQLKPVSSHNYIFYENHIRHPSLYDIYNHDIYKAGENTISHRYYKYRAKEHFSSNKPYQCSSSDINQNSQSNSYKTQNIRRSLPTAQDPYSNIPSNYNAKMYEPIEDLVKRHRVPFAKDTEHIHLSHPFAKDTIDPAKLYGNLLDAGLISNQTVPAILTKESNEEPRLDFQKDSTTQRKDGSLQQYSNHSNWKEFKAVGSNGLKIDQNTNVIYTSESEAKMANIVPIFNNEYLIRFPISLIKKLYDGKQCSTCGERGSVIDKEHMDKHFRQNELKIERKSLKSRNWYENEITNFEEQQERCIKDIHPEERQYAKRHPFIPGVNDMCSVCNEGFIQFYNQEEEEWQLKDAVIMDNKYFHEICSEDRNNV